MTSVCLILQYLFHRRLLKETNALSLSLTPLKTFVVLLVLLRSRFSPSQGKPFTLGVPLVLVVLLFRLRLQPLQRLPPQRLRYLQPASPPAMPCTSLLR